MTRARFAPSPTGSLHLGNALSAVGARALADWLLLRIDDTDQARNVPGGEAAKAILRELKAVGGDLRALRLALTGRERGPELWAIVAALPRDETLRRIDAAL